MKKNDKKNIYRSIRDESLSTAQLGGSLDNHLECGYYLVEINNSDRIDLGLPVEKCGNEHSLKAHLFVTDSCNDKLQKNRVIGQTLVLSQCNDGKTSIYSRSYSSIGDGYKWSLWSKVQQDVQVGQVTSLDGLTSSGIYSGVYSVAGSSPETFVLTVIDNGDVATAAGKVRSISQFKYAVNVDGTFCYMTRVGNGKGKIVWGEWVDFGAATTTDIQDNSITEQKLSIEVKEKIEKMDSTRLSLSVRKFHVLPQIGEVDDQYQTITHKSLNILGKSDVFAKLKVNSYGGAITYPIQLTNYGVTVGIPIHLITYIYSDMEQECEHQLYQNGYLVNKREMLSAGWNKIELEYTFETMPTNHVHYYIGKIVGSEFYYYKTFIYNGVTIPSSVEEVTNYELDSRLSIVEGFIEDFVESVYYDNEDVVFEGNGKNYDAKMYSTPVVAGDVFVLKLDGITKPESSTDDSYFRLQFRDSGNSNVIADKFFFASNTPLDTEITIPDGCIKLTYMFGLSSNRPSVLDGEYKWSGLTFKQLARNEIRFDNIEKRVNSLETLATDWIGKVLSTYGDSVTALQGGDFDIPYNETSYRWGNRVANYLRMSKHYGRGIGGQKYAWGVNGGSITWIEKATGNMIGRNDNFNIENWDGTTLADNISAADKERIISGLADGTVIPIRGCACSWLRITSMYPEGIKNEVDAVFVMFHNDGVDGTGFSWVEGDTTDPEWATSEQYATYGGDYNIGTLEGGIASTIMKLQAWMPNAVIILGTPINGQGTTGQLRPDAGGLYKQVQHVKNVGLRFSIPVIDVYATCGINGLNRTDYITDSIHPYCVEGSKMIARAVIGGFKNILPKLLN